MPNKILVVVQNNQKIRLECAKQLAAHMPDFSFVYFDPTAHKGFLAKFRFSLSFKRALAGAKLILIAPGIHAENLGKSVGKIPVLPLPEGVDFEKFNDEAEHALFFPDELFNIKNPIIGHLGVINSSSNLEHIKEAASEHPEWNFVFVGAVETDISELSEFPNIYFLGEKERAVLPAYLSRFDVCINISRDDLADAGNLYQYLSTGKPIVSTPQPPQFLDYTEVIYLAGTTSEFIALCKRAIGERDAWKVRRRIEFGRAASFPARASELTSKIKEVLSLN